MVLLKGWKKHAIVILLLLFIVSNCDDGTVGSGPSNSEPVPVKPVDITPPKALFADLNLLVDGKQSKVIMDQLIKLIGAVPKDGSIYISIYMFDYEPLIEALKRAHTRDVSLHVMIDGSDRSDNEATAEDLNELEENVEIVRIYNSASNSAINHNKFVLFPEVTTDSGIMEDVIFQTSQNFTESGTHKIQDGIILSDADLYEAYWEYWEDMKSLANVQMEKFNYREHEDAEKGISAYFHPKIKGGTVYGEDTIIEILEGIDDPSSAEIKIGMSAWTDSRIVIIEKLSELLSQGADLQIITKNSIGDETYNGLERLADNGATVRIYNMSNSGPQKVNIHSKFMMIEGSWNGDDSQLLLTGTQNFTMNALRNNNEVTLLFKDHEFFSDYEAYFEDLKDLPGVCCTSQSFNKFSKGKF